MRARWPPWRQRRCRRFDTGAGGLVGHTCSWRRCDRACSCFQWDRASGLAVKNLELARQRGQLLGAARGQGDEAFVKAGYVSFEHFGRVARGVQRDEDALQPAGFSAQFLARLPALQGRCVLLIDDVMTATEALLRADAVYVSTAVLALVRRRFEGCSQSDQKPDRAPNASDLQATVTSSPCSIFSIDSARQRSSPQSSAWAAS